MRRLMLVLSVFVMALSWVSAPALSSAIMAHAKSRQQPSLLLSVTFDGDLGAGGWFSAPVRLRATASHPEAVITYSLNGADAVEGSSLFLEEPGQYVIIWNACKGETCHDPYEQFIKIAAFEFEPLSYDPDRQEWSFTGRVQEVISANVLGYPGKVALVQSRYFAAWVVLKAHRVQLSDAEVTEGDPVRVWIGGTHVLADQIDWSLCEGNFEYCSIGEVLDDGLFGLDSGYKLSPSNQLIRAGRISKRWQTGALFWSTQLLERDRFDINRDRPAARKVAPQ